MLKNNDLSIHNRLADIQKLKQIHSKQTGPVSRTTVLPKLKTSLFSFHFTFLYFDFVFSLYFSYMCVYYGSFKNLSLIETITTWRWAKKHSLSRKTIKPSTSKGGQAREEEKQGCNNILNP